MRLHHLGFVVPDICDALDRFARALGATSDGRIWEDPHQSVKVSFLTTQPNGPQVELVQPIGDSSPVARFLREKGGGLHHACYEVDNLEDQIVKMRSAGGILARKPKPAVAFDGRRIAWILTSDKFLIELLERSARAVL
ncbi:MAG: VOC family protein [Candidatus Korobacteraceae bacterium]|jgi:methylmalonyl-CoA/ethylmalonyl-CoA epimerase